MTTCNEYVPLVLRFKSNTGGPEWQMSVNLDGTVTKPEGMTEAEAIILASYFASGVSGQHCPFGSEVLNKWAPDWGKPATIPLNLGEERT